MRERSVLFTAGNRAKSIAGDKTQTRRVIVPQPVYHDDPQCNPKFNMEWQAFIWSKNEPIPEEVVKCARYQVGDHLWMLEPYQMKEQFLSCNLMMLGNYLDDGERFGLKATEAEWERFTKRKFPFRRTSSRFMYKVLARYWYEVTEVRAEWVQDISEADAKAEGIVSTGGGRYWIAALDRGFTPRASAREAFRDLWDSINEKRGFGWDKNPLIFVYEFKRIER